MNAGDAMWFLRVSWFRDTVETHYLGKAGSTPASDPTGTTSDPCRRLWVDPPPMSMQLDLPAQRAVGETAAAGNLDSRIFDGEVGSEK